MPAVFILNPPRGGSRKNKGTSVGVQKSWKTRRAKYGGSGDRQSVIDAHKAGYTISGIRRMSPADRKKVGRGVLESLGLTGTKKAKKAKPKAKTTRRNAWYHHTEGHSTSAKKKWRSRPDVARISLYTLIKQYGIKEGQRRYAALSDERRSFSRSRGKEISQMASKRGSRRSKTRRRNPIRKRGVAVAARRNRPKKRKSAKRAAAARRGWAKRKRSGTRKNAPRRRRRKVGARKVVRRRRRTSVRKNAPRRRRRRNVGVSRRRRRSYRRNPSRRRRSYRRNPSRRRRTYRRNPSIMTRLKAAIPTMADLKDGAGLLAGFLGTMIAAPMLFRAVGLHDKMAAKLGQNVAGYVEQGITTVIAAAGIGMIKPRWSKFVLIGGVMGLAYKVMFESVIPKLKLSATMHGNVMHAIPNSPGRGFLPEDSGTPQAGYGDYVRFPARRNMGDYVQFGDYVKFGQFAPPSAVGRAAQIPSYQPGPYEVGMPMGSYDDLEGYYGVTAY